MKRNGNVLATLNGNMDGFLLAELLMSIVKTLGGNKNFDLYISVEGDDIVIRRP